MLNDPLSVAKAIETLNELLKLDPNAVEALFKYRVPCNKDLTNHPTVQVKCYDPDKIDKVGLLGLLNGLFGTFDEGPKKGWGPIAAVLESAEGPVLSFRRTDNSVD